MTKCELCGEEVPLPFACPYCSLSFCAKHRLPENHECISLPKEPFWYQRQKATEKEAERKRTSKKKEFPRSLTNALIATFIIALLIGGSIVIPVIAAATNNPIIMVVGILGLLFLIFLLLAHFKD
ncbi:MAG: hypothetical protein NWE91_09085 [Candidatus Bathyarchaeota archaeon]|nr:hypothetical protein [Candidatus Bathyarchaeota archaeon]